jgi:hypothetical protein
MASPWITKNKSGECHSATMKTAAVTGHNSQNVFVLAHPEIRVGLWSTKWSTINAE